MSDTSRMDRELTDETTRAGLSSTDRKKEIQRTKSIFDYFTAPAFREGQKEAIKKVYTAFKRGFKYVILNAPTGIGKSHIARTFAMAAKKTHIITAQKILQDQYASDFNEEMFIMKGRSAYRCLLSDEQESCATGLCKKKKMPSCSDCPYRLALKKAQMSKVTVHNFDSFYYQSTFARAFMQRPLLIVDEAHNIENKYLNFVEFTISNRKASDLHIPKLRNIEDYDVFLRTVRDSFQKTLDKYEEMIEIDSSIMTQAELIDMEDISTLLHKIDKYFNSRKDNIEYVFDFDEHEGNWESITFRPVLVGSFVIDSLMPFGKRVLLMSATILDKDIFCESIGIDAAKTAYISIDNHFPVENRPIYKDYIGSMSYKNIKDTLPLIMRAIKQILQLHPNERGIIHTVSRRNSQYIKEHIRDSRLTFNMDFRDVIETLSVHEKKKNSFIVASGLKEGVDLKEDLSRVQILIKAPFLNLGDKRVKRRKELNPAWYGYMAVLMFVQSVGRSIRSSQDKATTYLLDSDFDFFFRVNKKFIPAYIRRAIVDAQTIR